MPCDSYGHEKPRVCAHAVTKAWILRRIAGEGCEGSRGGEDTYAVIVSIRDQQTSVVVVGYAVRECHHRTGRWAVKMTSSAIPGQGCHRGNTFLRKFQKGRVSSDPRCVGPNSHPHQLLADDLQIERLDPSLHLLSVWKFQLHREAAVNPVI
eukprot:CAMPEP_0114536346 /NCGR_PEP_ID=MMETSP0109-20121206/28948_1 /TAXON_ID=29199 /ORGANISM="Chlorarachnion reptans, Strain CCCM449" /LENGTH=151 /DNA_ID=CAMNT_0001720067 /DNA_START=312 /DNA_END=767 /DNA_ORIENTATION=+